VSKKLKERIRKRISAFYKGRTKKIILYITIPLLLLLAMFLFLFVVVSIYVLFTYPLTPMALSIGIGMTILFVMFLITTLLGVYVADIEAEEFRPRWFTLRTMKLLALFGFGLLIIFIVFYSLDQYLSLFPETISATLLVEVSKLIIQTNGFLIGFSGIVFGQIFWAIHNQQCDIQKEMRENEDKEKESEYEARLRVLERNRILMIFAMFLVIIFFVVSILSSFSAIAQTEILVTLPKNPHLTQSIVTMIAAIFYFMFFIAISRTTYSKKEVQAEIESIQKRRAKNIKQESTIT
jgi:hypothetical protein